MKKEISRRDLAKADKRKRILEASRKHFSADGFDGTTVQQIANTADVAVGTLFLYVADKSELLLLLFHEAIERELRRAAKHLNTESDLITSVTRFFSRIVSLYQKDLSLSRIYIREFLFHTGQIRMQLDQQNAAILKLLSDRIEAAKQLKGVHKSVDSETAALHMYALYHSTVAFHLASCLPSQSPSKVLSTLLNSYWVGLQPRPDSQIVKRTSASRRQRQ
jgi:AcrR family transcriptional regulator